MDPHQLNMEKVFRDRFRDYSPGVPKHTWADIQSNLDHNRKKRLNYYRVAATVAVLIMSGLLYYFSTVDLNTNFFALRDKNYPVYSNENISGGNNSPSVSHKISQSRFSKINKTSSGEENTEQKSGIRSESSNQQKMDKKLTPRVEGIATREKQNELAALDDRSKNEEVQQHDRIVHYFSSLPVEEPDALKKPVSKKLSLSAGLSPTLSYRTVIQNASYTDPELQGNAPDESSLLAYSSGLGVGYEVFDNLRIRSGLYYSQIGQRLDNVVVSSESYTMRGTQGYLQVSNSWGNVELMSDRIQPKPPEDINEYGPVSMDATSEYNLDNTLTQRLEFLKVPLMMEVRILDTKIGLDIIGGFNANFLINNGVYMRTPEKNQYVGETTGLEKVNYSSVLGFGFNYDISDHTKFFVQPMFDYYLHTMIEDNIRVYPYSFNLFTGFSVYF